MLEYRWY